MNTENSVLQNQLLTSKLKELRILSENANIKMSDIEGVLDNMEHMQKINALKKHPYQIWFGSDKNWHTYLPSEKGGRVPRKRKSREELERVIVRYWTEQEENPTIQTIFMEWVNSKLERNEISKATYDRYNTDFQKFFTDFAKQRIKMVEPIAIEDFLLESISKYSLTAKAYSNLRTLVYGIFKRAKKKRLISYSITDIVNDIEISRNAFKRIIKEDYQEVFMEDEEPVVKQYLTDHPDILNLGLLLMFVTGVRVGELVCVRYSDIDGNIIHIRHTETRYRDENGKNVFAIKEMPKTAAGIRDVIIPKDYTWILKKIRLLNPFGEFLFMKNGERVRTYTIRKRLSRVCELTRVYKKSPHKIRKTYGSILLDNEVDTTLIISQMGHTDILCTEKHYHRNRKNMERKAFILDNIPEFIAK